MDTLECKTPKGQEDSKIQRIYYIYQKTNRWIEACSKRALSNGFKQKTSGMPHMSSMSNSQKNTIGKADAEILQTKKHI